MIRPTNVFTLVAWLLVLLLAPSAHAAPSSPRVQLDGPSTDPVYRRIQSELRLLEIQVDRAPEAAGAQPPSSESSSNDPAAVVAVEPTRVSIRLGQRHGGGELVVQRRAGERPGVVALAAVELLRARIVHPRESTGSTPQSSASNPGGTPGTSSPARDRNASGNAAASTGAAPAGARSPWGLFVGPGIAASAGDVPATMVLQVAADWRSHFGLYATARVLPGLTRASWEIEAGSCSQRMDWAALATGYAFVFGRDRWALALGAGGGVLRSSYKTVPDAANKASEARSGAAWAGILHIETSLAWYPVAHLGLALSGLVGTATSSIDLPNRARALPESSNADQTGASFGRPLGVLSLGLEARF